MNIVSAVVASFAAALALLFEFIPRLLGFLLIILIGYFVATAIQKGVAFLLRKANFDRVGDRIGLTRLLQQSNINTDAADVLSRIAYWFVFLIFLVPAVNALGLTSVSDLLTRLVSYIPNVFVAILILFLGVLAANVVGDIVRGAASSSRVGSPRVLSALARYAIIGFVAIVALEQLGIATALLNILFAAIVFSAALAAALAFGFGGQDAAHRYLDRFESSVNQASTRIQTQQAQQEVEQARTLPPTAQQTRPDAPYNR